MIGSVDRALKIEHARIWIGHHQVARMVIAMDIDPRLREVVVENAPEHVAQCVALRRVERNADVPRDVPVREQIELAAQHRFVVWRKHASRCSRAASESAPRRRRHRAPAR